MACMGWWYLQPDLKAHLPVPMKNGQHTTPRTIGRPSSFTPSDLDCCCCGACLLVPAADEEDAPCWPAAWPEDDASPAQNRHQQHTSTNWLVV